MKAGLAACMLALADFRPGELAGDVLLAAVADEEHASLGIQDVLKRIRADAAIVTEPTSLQVCIAHKGFSWHEIITSGRAAHGSQPQFGIDAIVHMGRVLTRLEALQAELRQRAPHRLLGHGSLHASLISGGQELSSYPATCTLQLERRTLPAEDLASVEQEIEGLLSALAALDPQFQARQRTTMSRPPFSVSENELIVETLLREASIVLGANAHDHRRELLDGCGISGRGWNPDGRFWPAWRRRTRHRRMGRSGLGGSVSRDSCPYDSIFLVVRRWQRA